MKNIRLNASARGTLKDALRKMSGGRNALRRSWENYLIGRKPNHAITFDSDAASKDRNSFFITPMHPLARQAAEYFSKNEPIYLKLQFLSDTIPAGAYPFSVYAWKYTGFKEYTRLVTVCRNEQVEAELPDILENGIGYPEKATPDCDWSDLEEIQILRWQAAHNAHRQDVAATTAFRLESLENNYCNRIRSLEQQAKDATDESIRRMKLGELERAEDEHSNKTKEVHQLAAKADIYTTLLVNGIITVMEG